MFPPPPLSSTAVRCCSPQNSYLVRSFARSKYPTLLEKYEFRHNPRSHRCHSPLVFFLLLFFKYYTRIRTSSCNIVGGCLILRFSFLPSQKKKIVCLLCKNEKKQNRIREAQRLTNQYSMKSYSSINDVLDDESQDERGSSRDLSSAGLAEETPGELMKIRSMLTDKKMNVMLIFVPAGFFVNYLGYSATTIFVVNFLAMMVSAAHWVPRRCRCYLCIGMFLSSSLSSEKGSHPRIWIDRSFGGKAFFADL